MVTKLQNMSGYTVEPLMMDKSPPILQSADKMPQSQIIPYSLLYIVTSV